LKPDSAEIDANLVAAVGAGDMHALGELVKRHQRGILLFAYRTLGRWDLAEDVAQDVFLRVHRSAARYKPTAKVTTWIYRIAVNLSFDVLRSRKRRPVRLADDTSLAAPAGRDLIEARERIDMVQQAVADLPDRQRVVINLHRYKGMSHKDITDSTGWSQSAVESLLVRAYANLRQSLSELKES